LPGNVPHLNSIAMWRWMEVDGGGWRWMEVDGGGLSSKHNNAYSFSLTDENGELIQLNGLNMNMTLLFFKQDPIIDQIRNFLRMIVSK